jgi:RluA family pseudouridine synthase
LSTIQSVINVIAAQKFAQTTESGYARRMPEFIVQNQDADLSIAEFLRLRIPAAPEAYLRQLIKKKKVRSALGPLTAQTKLTGGEVIQLPESARLLELLSSPEKDPASGPKTHVLYETREILIVYKPAGLAIHSSQGHERDNLTHQVQQFSKTRGEQFQLSPIQRLDLETSGPVLFGKGKKSCSELGKLFMNGEVKKIYLALVEGKVKGRGTLISDIPAKGKIKTAETAYETLASNQSASLLEIQLRTGRQHQIRRQLADAGHPLFGDRRYHGPCPHKLFRLFLHCRNLSFIDPFTHQQIDINCPLPEALTKFLKLIEIQN